VCFAPGHVKRERQIIGTAWHYRYVPFPSNSERST